MNQQNPSNAAARDAAERALAEYRAGAAGVIEYRSRGRVLVIGQGDVIDGAAFMLPPPLSARLLRMDPDADEDAVSVPLAGRSLSITGYLGHFEIRLGEEGRPERQVLSADMVLDLSAASLLAMPLKPPGYLWSRTDPDSIEDAVAELGELAGTFEKPRYVEYDAAICAHGRSGQPGCNRCVESCPAEAITALVETVEVDPYLCQGGGVCQAVCPTGAIRYAFPHPADTLERVRRALRAYAEAGGKDPVVAFVAESDAAAFASLPDNVLLLEAEELASVGIETWLSALAFGARQVVLLAGSSVPDASAPVIDEQYGIARRILAFLGYDPLTLVKVEPGTAFPAVPTLPEGARKVMHAPLDDKRNMLFAAVDTLAAHLDTTGVAVDMPAGAPFGRVAVSADACTLCMACTSVCPAQALVAGGDSPKLVFHEVNCVQCGICANACPEGAITLEPRLNLDIDARRRGVTAHEEAPFLCVQCGKPFATRSVIERMLGKLKDHPMFATERARRRLKMCDDCRVVDVVQDDDAMNPMV